jgi:hypothetical protein
VHLCVRVCEGKFYVFAFKHVHMINFNYNLKLYFCARMCYLLFIFLVFC